MKESHTLKRWTKNEVQILTENIDKILEESGPSAGLSSSTPTLVDLAALFDRTVAAVHHKCRLLAVKEGKLETRSSVIARKADVPVLQGPVDPSAVLRQIYGKVSYDDFVKVSNALNPQS